MARWTGACTPAMTGSPSGQYLLTQVRTITGPLVLMFGLSMSPGKGSCPGARVPRHSVLMLLRAEDWETFVAADQSVSRSHVLAGTAAGLGLQDFTKMSRAGRSTWPFTS